MKADKKLLDEIKKRVLQTEPDAKVILYGSYARGDANEESDLDLLILVDRDVLSYQDKVKITRPLYSLEVETGQIISPLVKTKHTWEDKYYYTSLYFNIQKEGMEI
jgi:predicted nucleotidyltransferase